MRHTCNTASSVTRATWRPCTIHMATLAYFPWTWSAYFVSLILAILSWHRDLNVWTFGALSRCVPTQINDSLVSSTFINQKHNNPESDHKNVPLGRQLVDYNSPTVGRASFEGVSDFQVVGSHWDDHDDHAQTKEWLHISVIREPVLLNSLRVHRRARSPSRESKIRQEQAVLRFHPNKPTRTGRAPQGQAPQARAQPTSHRSQRTLVQRWLCLCV